MDASKRTRQRLKMNKFTKGPWNITTYLNDAEYSTYGEYNELQYQIINQYGDSLMLLRGANNHLSVDEAKANANLVSEAPNMFDLLEEFDANILYGKSLSDFQDRVHELLANIKTEKVNKIVENNKDTLTQRMSYLLVELKWVLEEGGAMDWVDKIDALLKEVHDAQ